MKLEIRSEKDMIKLARNFAKYCKGGEIFSLDGDLGAGKTFFTRNFVESFLKKDLASSPTYTIMNIYNEKIYHYDFYRLETEEELQDIGFYDFLESNDKVTIIEWFNRINPSLGKDIIKINITKGEEINDRVIDISIGDSYNYIKI